MGTNEQKIQKNTYDALNKLFLKKDRWTKLQIMSVLMDIGDVYAGGRLIQRWLDAKVSIGFFLNSLSSFSYQLINSGHKHSPLLFIYYFTLNKIGGKRHIRIQKHFTMGCYSTTTEQEIKEICT